jgi:uncharacterized protein (TIGR01777 family)
MKIVIPGGSGKVGTVLARAFHRFGHDVVVLSRNPRPAPWRVVLWDGRTRTDWFKEVEAATVVINLAGRSVDCRYTPANRESIRTSRLESTRVVGEAIARAMNPPRVWLQASTATIYAHRYDVANDEKTGLLGGNEPDSPDTWRFSIDVAMEWERALNGADTPRTRKVLMRSAMTMSPDHGGIFDVLLRLVRFGLGGNVGDGRQFVSWIHEHDFVSAVQWLIDHEDISGPVNLASPNPVPYSQFMAALRSARGVSVGLPATKWMLEIGTFLMRTESELVLKSRRVIPTRLLQSGFRFQYPTWPEAAKDLCARWQLGMERKRAS